MKNPLLYAAALMVLLSGCLRPSDQELERLDAVLKEDKSYVSAHENLIRSVESTLISDHLLPDSVRFVTFRRLFELNYSFHFESSLAALNRQEEIAISSGREDWMSEVMLHKAMLYSIAGLYDSSMSCSDSIDISSLTHEQLVEYYEYRQHFCRDYYKYYLPDSDPALLEEAYRARQKVMELTDEDDFKHGLMHMLNHIDDRQYEAADSIAAKMLSGLPSDSHEYAIVSYYRGTICYFRGDLMGERHWYIESAIADIKTATKDNASLYSLALNLLNVEDDIDRSFHYTQLALDDALFYNAKLRPFQIAQNLPKIESAYSQRRMATEKRLTVLIIIISVLAAGLLLVIFYIFSYHKRLRKAIDELSEASAAKEEYLALFLSMSSGYLDKLRHFLSRSQMEDELKDFYRAFDNAFIHLYPNFVSEFNELLVPEAHVELKEGELLNTQLRIFALIRLGIDQSSHIASLLRYSVNTIYNYRAQTKAAALSGKDDFETLVKEIGRGF